MVKTLGSKVAEVASSPESLRGKKISLNLRSGCKWNEPPTRDPRLHMDAATSPTVTIPADADPVDLHALFLKIKVGHMVLGDQPVPEFEQQPDVLARHLRVFREDFPEDYTKDYIGRLFRGPTFDGGYNKLAILEEALVIEEAKKGRARKVILENLRLAIKTIATEQGGVSRVQSEPKTVEPSTSGRHRDRVDLNPKTTADLLGIE